VTTLSLVAIGVLLLLNGYFVAAEFALVSTRPERLGDASRLARLVQRQRKQLDEYLSACQLGITIASLALGALGEPTLAHLIEPALGSAPIAHLGAATATVLALLLMTALHITIGEQAPKSFAIGSAERVAMLAAWPLELFYRSLRPLVRVLNRASNSLVRAFGGTPASDHGGRATINELRQMIYAVASTGEVDTTDERILRGMFTLDERRASEVMTPFPRLATAESGQTVEDVLRVAVPSGHSRIPVMDPQADRRALGVVFVRELTEVLLQGRGERPVEAYLHELLVTPETQPLDRLLARMQRPGRRSRRCSTSTASSRASSPWRTSWSRSWARSRTRATARRASGGCATGGSSARATPRSRTSRRRACTSARRRASRSAG
jgi:CBS domain containing-hemolysin-like protein